MMSQETAHAAIDRLFADACGQRVTVGFIGGEPFLNREMTAILELTLQYGPATVLTNGTVFKDEWLERLRTAEQASLYSLEFRVSMDGYTPAENDAVRGAGTFERILHGVRMLLDHDFLPILTVTKS